MHFKILNCFTNHEAKYKATHGKGLLVMLASIAKVSYCSLPSDLAHAAKIYDRKHLNILTPEQMLYTTMFCSLLKKQKNYFGFITKNRENIVILICFNTLSA